MSSDVDASGHPPDPHRQAKKSWKSFLLRLTATTFVIILGFGDAVAAAPSSSALAGPWGVRDVGGFPEGRWPDGMPYKTDYKCEGETMTMSCESSDGPSLDGVIRVVRANYGRFSIAICNPHGHTDWSVSCFAPQQTTKTLRRLCDGKSQCVVDVNSSILHDACPGTLKYLEIHYDCESRGPIVGDPKQSGNAPPLPPPWLASKAPPKSQRRNGNKEVGEAENAKEPSAGSTVTTLLVRKPILVTERPSVESERRRVPITTPTSTSTSTATTTTALKTTEIVKLPPGRPTTESLEPQLVETPFPSKTPRPTRTGFVGYDSDDLRYDLRLKILA